jgi:hypothetical protein
MFRGYVHDLATQMGVPLSTVSVVDGRRVGCLDVSLLKLTANGQTVMALVSQADIENLVNGKHSDLLETKIRSALTRLVLLLQP